MWHSTRWLAVGKGAGERVDQRCKEEEGSTEKKWSCERTTVLKVTAFSLVDA